MRTPALMVALALLASPSVHGAVGNPQHGKQIVQQGAQGVAACVACHGLAGEGNKQRGYPRLALLSAGYIAHELQSFKGGSRPNPIMRPIAAGLSAQDIADVAAWFSTQRLATLRFKSPPAHNVARGGRLAEVGDPQRALPACFGCHGPYAEGNPPAFPRLAGQFSNYLVAQLQAFRQGARHNDPGHFMQAVARRLSEKDMHAVADYLAQLSPPAKGGQGARP